MRRGFTLIEMIVALGLAAGPLIGVIGLVQAQAREVHAVEESERMSGLLTDALNLLATETPERLARLGAPAGQPELQALVDGLLAGYSPGHGRAWTVSCTLAPGGVRGLALLSLSAQRDTGARLELRRLLRTR